MNFPVFKGSIPAITAAQMIEVDRLMVEKYQIELLQMMENAGRALALVAKDAFLGGSLKGKKVMVLAGTGANGGGAMAAARRLHNWGAEVRVVISKPSGRMMPAPAHQLGILRNLEVSIQLPNALETETGKFDLIIDGIVGYNLEGEPKGSVKTMIEWVNNHKAPVLSLDTPSGVDPTTGVVFDPAIRADATLTLALPKKGLSEEAAKAVRGKLFLADISVPPALYAEPSVGVKVGNLFTDGDILQIE
jgi:NAD(P)H-hydrate epimerase